MIVWPGNFLSAAKNRPIGQGNKTPLGIFFSSPLFAEIPFASWPKEASTSEVLSPTHRLQDPFPFAKEHLDKVATQSHASNGRSIQSIRGSHIG